VDSLKLNDDGTFNENFIIKGNNLLALYSLLPRYKGKVKLVYIDPPYNTGNDGFRYNDNFNHSTWLTFMKNRLEIARELLRDDGVIFVQCDDNEQAYLKVLMDEVFGRENFVGNFIWKNKLGGGNDSSVMVSEHEYTVVFSKSIKNISPFTSENKDNGKYLYEDKFIKERGKYALEALYRSSIQYSESLFYPIEAPDGALIYPNESDKNSNKHIWRWSKDTFEKKKSEGRVEFRETKNGWRVFSKQYFLQDDDGNERRLKIRSIIDFIGNRQGTEHLKSIFDGKVFNNPKPEQILEYFIEISTNPGDIVLDYHLGSGTTCAVAHKMGRRYIGIEQMDYIETIAVERLKKVVGKQVKSKDLIEDNVCEDFDTGGISKAVNWQGGGDFIYLELTKNNIIYLEKIEGLASGSEAWSLFEELADSIWISYRVDIDKFKEHKDQFLALELEDQKKILKDVINYNHLYVNYEDMEDIAYKDCGLSTEDKALTTQFYEKKPTDQNELL
jgi:adenine-specific DNA-methyltransferase